MKAKMMQIWTMVFVVSALTVGLLVLNGCKKSENPQSSTSQEMQGHEGHEHMAMEAKPAAQTAEETETIEQKTCPVMVGNPIDKNVFVEYKGKKVYFCCPDCKAKFNADPEKYIARLPQFKQQS